MRQSRVHLRCRYTSACSMSNKQEKLLATVHLESCDLFAATDTWWDESHDWSTAIDGCKLFRRDKKRKVGDYSLYVKIIIIIIVIMELKYVNRIS